MSIHRLQNHQFSNVINLFAVAGILIGLATFAAAQTETLIASLPHSLSGLIFDSAGNLYGTTDVGGNFSCGAGFGCGAVFELSPASGGGWTQTVLAVFEGGNHGIGPSAGLVFDAAGNLYGTTVEGGDYGTCPFGCGVVFKVTRASKGTWTEKQIRLFTAGKDGAYPNGPVIIDSQGNLYGTTSQGGQLGACGGLGCGTVFKLTPTSNTRVPWQLTLLHEFTGGADGSVPLGPLTFDAEGNLYGVTRGGGNFGSACAPGGCGVAFKLTAATGAWPETILHTFLGADGFEPNGGLISDGSGNLYGTTVAGGTPTWGVAFKLSHAGNSWKETTIYNFTGGSDGGNPVSGLTLDSAGNLYGASNGGFANGCDGSSAYCGQVFKLSPTTTGWKFDAQYPTPFTWNPTPGALVRDSSGNIYGIANEDLFFEDGGGAYQIIP